jgi:inosine-uridine nucleoside N-ribohydrolase
MIESMNARPKSVLIDVDPGIDDTLAILLALGSPELCVEAFTVVAGNVDVDQGLRNVLKVLELAGRTDIPVARGAEKPLRGKLHTARHVHGESGLGDIELPEHSMKPHPGHASDLIAAKVEEHAGGITLVPLGPLTNIARVLTKHPFLAPKIKEIVIMGGSFSGGNITPAAEFNMYNDPEAAAIVLDSGIPIILLTLDVTRKTVLHPSYLEGVRRDANPVSRLVLDLNDYYSRSRGGSGILLHDPLAVGVAIDRSFVHTEPSRVEVETAGGERRGSTIANRRELETNVEICTDVDAHRFVRFFVERVIDVPPPKRGRGKS